VAYLEGRYFQSLFEVQTPTYDYLDIPSEFKTAIVFYNKTSSAVANHTALQNYLNFNTYVSNYLGLTNKDGVEACRKDYFASTVNPVVLEDCLIFPSDKRIDFSFYLQSPTRFGFMSELKCNNPFQCAYAGNTYYLVFTNITTIYQELSFTLYFTSRSLNHKGEFEDQLFSLSSNQWSTPTTYSSDLSAQLQFVNTTLDHSVLPWKQ
jgi:hypothetical protein